jgi:DNA-binding transcriptional ArsR family regulator
MTRPVYSEADRADVFRGLAHPVRRKVLATLGKAECSAGELLTGLRMSQPALSGHLKVLRDTGLVRQRVEGHRRFYRVNAPALRKAQRWLQQIG